MLSAKDLLERLNSFDECNYLEAKTGSQIDRSILETVCAFSNEPGLGGGYILLGIQRDDANLFPIYRPVVLADPDKLQSDLASVCATTFNVAIRPIISLERVQGYTLINVFVPELAPAQKPIYFKNRKLPEGAYRRIGSTDQACVEDDMAVFYNHTETYDSSPLVQTSFADVDTEAVDLYRRLRAEVNPAAEELTLNDDELLLALGCAVRDKTSYQLTVAGLVLFGKGLSQRRVMPMLRTDYVRVPGDEWVDDPVNRFANNVDMRGPLLRMVFRAMNAVADDLPKGFLLPEGEIQARYRGLPGRVLREVVINAFMHQSYKVSQPMQIIRYSNRLEIRNPGFSLKPEDQLGEPGSKPRNPYIAAVFHDTNLAETKGSGIRTMRRLLEEAEMAPPTFESDHGNNAFTARLLLHHFLSEEQLAWLSQFDGLNLNLDQKKALIVLKGVGAINNPTYRQIAGCDTLSASMDLRKLRELGLIEQKGKSTATYYIPATNLQQVDRRFTDHILTNDAVELINDAVKLTNDAVELTNDAVKLTNDAVKITDDGQIIPETILQLVQTLGKRTNNRIYTRSVIRKLCEWKPLTLNELSRLMNRSIAHLFSEYIKPMLEDGELVYTIPNTPKHPNQAYKTPYSESTKN